MNAPRYIGKDVRVMMLLYARWITNQYGTPEYNINGFNGLWWKGTLEHFINNVYPKMLDNGSVKNTKDFLESNQTNNTPI